MTSTLLRVAVVQFAPKIGEVQANIAKARELCRGLTPRSVDLVCFPEMIFTGYMFPDAPSIAPYLEHPHTGPTASFCAELARRLECVVVAGYPERLADGGDASGESESSRQQPTHLVGANAATLHYASHPESLRTHAHAHAHAHTHVHTYHKSNLFPTDRTWARPGPGFSHVDLPAPLGRTAVAICNDLNVSAGTDGDVGVWTSLERGPYELAGWCMREGVRLVVLLNAWLKSEDGGMEGVGRGRAVGNAGVGAGDDEDGEEEEDGLEPNWEALNYWAMRLRPLWAKNSESEVDGTAEGDGNEDRDSSETSTSTDANANVNGKRDMIIVVCNRWGRERGKTFAGSSAMFSMRPGLGKPRLLHVMGEREEGVRVWTASIES